MDVALWMIDLHAIIKKTVFLNNPLAKANTIGKLVLWVRFPRSQPNRNCDYQTDQNSHPDFPAQAPLRHLCFVSHACTQVVLGLELPQAAAHLFCLCHFRVSRKY